MIRKRLDFVDLLVLILIWCASGVFLFVSGQTPFLLPIGEDELPSETVWCMHQDRLGYVWLATSGGLCRFDGVNIEVFTREDGLRSNNITWISEDSDRNLIISCLRKGLNKVQVGHQPLIEQIGREIYVNADVYVRNDRVFQPYIESHLYDKIEYREKFMKTTGSSLYYKRLIPWHDGTFLITTEDGLKRNDPSDEEQMDLVFSNGDKRMHSLQKIGYDRLLIGSEGVIYELKDWALKQSYKKGLPNTLVSTLFKDSRGDIYAYLVKHGVYVLRVGSDTFVPLELPEALDDVVINNFKEDDSGNIWLSSWGRGVYLLMNTPFVNYRAGKDIPIVSVQDVHVMSPSGQLIVSGVDELYRCEPDTCYSLDIEKNERGLANVSNLKSIGGRLFVANKNGRVIEHNTVKRPHLQGEMTYVHRGSLQLSADKEKGIWFSIRALDGTVYRELNMDQIGEQLDSVYIECIYYNDFHAEPFYVDDRQLWQASKQGLFYYDRETFRLYDSMADSTSFFIEELKGVEISKIKVNHPDSIWFCTDRGLIARLNGSWFTYTAHERMGNVSVKDLAFDEEGHLWLASSKGLIYFDFEHFYSFYNKHGLLENRLQAVTYDPDDQSVFVSNTNGYFTAKKEELLRIYDLNVNKYLAISEVVVEGEKWDLEQDILLEPDQEDLSFTLSLRHFKSFDETIYSYRLNEEEWVEQKEAEVKFQNLSPRKYTISFKASKDGLSWVNALPISFEVKPYWYETVWFYLLIAIYLLALSYLVFRVQLNRQAKRAAAELALNQKITHLEQRALANSMNPHFIFNVLASIQDYVQQRELEKVNSYFGKFGELIRLYLNTSSNQTISLEEELERVERYLELERLRFGEEAFKWDIDFGDELDIDLIQVPSMIIQPYVENAILHGIRPKGEGMVKIQCAEKGELLLIQIIDNGIGITASKQLKHDAGKHLNMASKITKERIQLFGNEQGLSGKVEVTEPKEGGTKVHIELPIMIE